MRLFSEYLTTQNNYNFITQFHIFHNSELSTRLPLVLVLGVATTVSAVHDRLPQSLTAHLHIVTFCGQKSTQLLESLLEHTITDKELPFRLGSKTLDHLVEMFVNDNFSVGNFLTYYKVLVRLLLRSTDSSHVPFNP